MLGALGGSQAQEAIVMRLGRWWSGAAAAVLVLTVAGPSPSPGQSAGTLVVSLVAEPA